jgi:hypothetical protein
MSPQAVHKLSTEPLPMPIERWIERARARCQVNQCDICVSTDLL